MTKSEFVLAVALIVAVGYLVLPPRLQAQIREEVARGIEAAEFRAKLARAEREHEQFISQHPEFAHGDHEANRLGRSGH